MLTIQVLTALHIVAACVLVGSTALLMRVTKRADAIPPREAARLSELLGVDVALVYVLALAVLGVTGLLRMVEQQTLGRMFDPEFVSSGYGLALVCMIALWVVLVILLGLMLLYFRPRLTIQLPYDSSRQVVDGQQGSTRVVSGERQKTGGQRALVREFLSLEGSTVPHLLALRRSLERKTAYLAAKRLTAEEAEELHRIASAMNAEDLDDEAYVRLDAALHNTIVAAAKDADLARKYAASKQLFRTYSLRVLQLPERRQLAHSDHMRIVEAVTARDSGAAKRAMTAHLDAVRSEVGSVVAMADRLDNLHIWQIRSDRWVRRLIFASLVVGVGTLVEAGFLSSGGF